MNDMMKVVKSFKESGLLIKEIRETIKKKKKNNMEELYTCY